MTFFYDLNKRLSQLAAKQDARQIAEHSVPATQSKSKLAQALNERDLGKHNNATTGFAALAKKTGGGEKGARIAGAQLAKMRAKGQVEETGSMTPKQKSFAKLAPPTDKITFADKIAGAKQEVDEMLGDVAADAMKKAVTKMADEGNAFTGKLKTTPKGGKFKLGNKDFTDTSDIDEGYAEMNAWMAQREKEKGTGKFDKKERTLPSGMKATTYTRKHEDDKEDNDDSKASQADKYASPKKKGRPKSAAPKDQERVTSRSHKYKTVDGKRVKKEKTEEGLDSDGVMMTSPTNCSMEDIEHKSSPKVEAWNGLMDLCERGEGMEPAVQKRLKQLVRKLKPEELELDEEKVEAGKREFFDKIAPAAKKAAKVIGAMSRNRTAVEEESTDVSKQFSKYDVKYGVVVVGHNDGKPVKTFDNEADAKAFADKGIQVNGGLKQGSVRTMVSNKAKKESTDKEDTKAERAGKKVAKDIEYDEGHKGKGDNKAEKAGKKVTKDIEYDDKKDRKEKKDDKKEEKVEETTVAGSVAPAQNAAPKAGKGMQFGKGVYEGYNKKFTQALNESISVQSKMEESGEGMAPSITITADGEEAAQLMMLLKLAGLESQVPAACPQCSATPCGCDEMVDENSPDWPTNTETLSAQPELRTYSGGLNGPKSTGQSTTPVLASQLRRQVSMEESVELERSLFKTWKNYKG